MEIVLSLIWWYPDEYELIKIVASNDSEFVKEYMKHDDNAYFHLISYGLLVDKTFEFKIFALKKYLQEYSEDWEKKIGPFKQSGFTEDMLPSEANIDLLANMYTKRAQLEQDLRKIVYMILFLNTGYNENSVAKKIIDCFRDEDDKIKKNDIFLGRHAKEALQELYFLDLVKIITKNWTFFSGLFDNQKSRFTMNMEELSKYRNDDAHVKKISEEEMSDFNNSHAWINKYVKKAITALSS